MIRLIVFAAGLIWTAALFPQGQVVFQDDFSDNHNTWWEGSNENYNFRVTNGAYVFDNFSQTTYTIAKNVGLSQDDDFVIETTIRKVSGVDNHIYGLLWGYQDADNCYAFGVSGNGYYMYGKWTAGQWQDLIAWTTSSSVNVYSGYGVTNRLKVEHTGERVDFYINDTYVNSSSWERPAGSQVGYVVTKTQRIEIEDLTVRKPGSSGYAGSGGITSWDNPYGHNTAIRAVAFDRNGNNVASLDESTQIKIWDVRSGVANQTINIRDGVSDIGVSADATKAIWWDSQNNVGVYDLMSGSSLMNDHSASTFGAEWARPFAISADGLLAAFRDQDFNVKVFATYSGSTTSVLRGSQNVYSMAFDGDGRTMAVGYASAAITLFDVYSGQILRTLTGYDTYYIRAIALSADGRLVASAGDSYCKVSDANSGQDVALLGGHTEGIDVITFSPDGRFVATGSADNSVRLWNIQTGTQVMQFTESTEDIKALAFSPDGQTLAGGGVDHTIRIWNIGDVTGGGYNEYHTADYGGQTTDVWSLAGAAFDQGDYPTAVNYFQQALSEAERNQNISLQADALTSLSITFERMSQYDLAREYSTRAIQSGGADHRPYYTLAKLAYDQGNYSESESYCRDGMARFPDNPDLKRIMGAILTVYGNNYYNSQSYGDAINYYQSSVQHYDQDANTYMLLGYSYYAVNQYGYAAQALERAEQLNPNIGQENSSFYEILNYCRSNR